MLRECVEQVLSSDGEGSRQLNDVFQGDVSLPTLHTADVVPVQPGSLRKLLLRIAAILSQGPHCCSEDRLRRSFSHPLMLGI
jgi:hypothetical protein